MRQLLPLLFMIFSIVLIPPGCVKKNRKCVKEHKKARKKGTAGWQY